LQGRTRSRGQVHHPPQPTFEKCTRNASHGAGADGINRKFDLLKQASFPSLTIYFHGGLVGLASGEAQANVLDKDFEEDKSSPLFVIWETGISTKPSFSASFGE
jgi:hypothetical protein